ncbi:AAA family ATPase [Pseudonocardia aurantiaca]|uniref:AAA family ATPase n=1 Tax=Pseudonocardia aurantiaca TaxID=75290 RepID=UPI0031DF3EFC
MAGTVLYGRTTEARRLRELLDGLGTAGAALIVRGGAGIGKSALLADLVPIAKARGLRVLSTTGVESEARLPFAGLHQLLRPVLDLVERLPGPQRAAMGTALGTGAGSPPDLFLIALAALTLLGDVANGAAVLVVVDDAQWLDPPSAEVLAFVARRLGPEPIAVLVATRDGARTPLDAAGLDELALTGLDADASAALLDSRAAGLSPAMRARVLAEAAGNPLALVELPVALGALDAEARPPQWLPLTERLEHAFGQRAVALPAATRTLLLVAALDEAGGVAEVVRAATTLLGAGVTADELAPAVSAGLVAITDDRLDFRHPLMRSAIRQAARPTRLQEAHTALADALVDDPDRHIWHHAAASSGPDEAIAAGLDAAATRAVRRGGVEAAVAALERAAQLTPDPSARAARLLRAAELATELGRRDTVAHLLREVAPLELTVSLRARMTWIEDVFDDGIRDPAEGAVQLADRAEEEAVAGEVDLALRLLWAAAQRCFWSELGDGVRRRVAAAADTVPCDPRDPRLLAVLAFAAPIDRGSTVVERLVPLPMPDGDAPAARLLGNAAMAVGAFDVALAVHTAAAAQLRAQGRIGLLARTLLSQANSAVHLGDLPTAIPAAAEATRLAEETSQPNLLALGQAYEAATAALRGHHDDADRLAAAAELAAVPVAARPVLATVQLARGLSALGTGRYSDAFDEFRRLFDRADPAFHLGHRCSAICFVSESAAFAGRQDEVRAIVAEMESEGMRTPSPALQAGLRFARAVLAPDPDAEPLFAALLVELAGWPFARSRAQLAYGSWLRRQRRPAESRPLLRAARDTFDALGLVPWGERARQELRASGETSRRRPVDVGDRLTPQELQIARLAAAGLSNREIGERLYLSRRTISTHLYRIFPKLGVSSRADLGAVIGDGTVT